MFEKITEQLHTLHQHARGRVIAYALGNTSDRFNDISYYPTPLRATRRLIYAGAIVRDVIAAEKIARIIDNHVHYIFVDAEKKIRKQYYGPNDVGNIERIVRERVFKSEVLTYKGNDLAADAVDILLGQLVVNIGNMNIAVIGAGNLGSKIALKLVERGAHVRVYRRNQEQLKTITDGLNAIKSPHILSSVTYTTILDNACNNADIVVACANEKGIIDRHALSHMNPHGPHILIDVGKGCFHNLAIEHSPFHIYRLDVAYVQQTLFESIITSRIRFGRPLGRKIIENYDIHIVSQGLLGKYGEVVVDDIDKPTDIIGIADGNGSMLTDTTSFTEKISILQSLIDKGRRNK